MKTALAVVLEAIRNSILIKFPIKKTLEAPSLFELHKRQQRFFLDNSGRIKTINLNS